MSIFKSLILLDKNPSFDIFFKNKFLENFKQNSSDWLIINFLEF